MYLLDTDVLSGLRKRSRDVRLVSWMGAQEPEALFISVITIMEIERSIEQERRRDPRFAITLTNWLDSVIADFGERVLQMSSDAAKLWGQLQIQLKRSDYDVAIAAVALEHGFGVVTRNVRHFDKTGVSVIDPFVSKP